MNVITILIYIILSSCIIGKEAMPISKVIVDDGRCMTCMSGANAYSIMKLYWFDLTEDKPLIQMDYLRGSVAMENRKEKKVVSFPHAWTCSNRRLKYLRPSFSEDAIGRVTFHLQTDNLFVENKDLRNEEVQLFLKQDNQFDINYDNGDEEHLTFMVSYPFLIGFIKPETNHIWYGLSHDELLAMIPSSKESLKETEPGWGAMEKPPYFKWKRYGIEDRSFRNNGRWVTLMHGTLSDAGVRENDGWTPFFGEKTAGKSVLLDGRAQTLPDGLEWLVLFRNSEGEVLARGLFTDNHWEIFSWPFDAGVSCAVVNHDSQYILLSSTLSVDAGDVSGSLQKVTGRLREMKLLKDYPPRERHVEEEGKVPETPPPVVRRDGFLEKAGEIASFIFRQMKYVRLFTDDELKELLADPDPSNFKTPVELGLAYDWVGKFSEAKAELEKDQTLQGRFELGRFLVTGRPGMPADRPRGNSLLESVVNELEGRVNTLTASECLLGARACLSMELEMAKEWQKCQRISELCANFCEKAIGMGENAGHYYLGRAMWKVPRPRGLRQDIERFWQAFPSDDPEACTQAILYCATEAKYMDRRDIVPHLKMLKNAIRARNNRAQYVLGMLYLHGGSSHGHAYLSRDVDRARFWLTRAAERGDPDASSRLKYLPRK